MQIISFLAGLAMASQTDRPPLPNTAPTGNGPFVYEPGRGTIQADTLRPLLQPISSTMDPSRPVHYQNSRGPERSRLQRHKKPTDVVAHPFNVEKGNGKALDTRKEPKVITDPLNAGWQLFQFGSLNQEAMQSYAITSKTEYIRVRITDMYYGGDRFAIYNMLGHEAEMIIETPKVDSDGTRRRVTDPNAAFKSVGVWSSGEVHLKPGKYLIVIMPKSSPYNGGTAAIRFDTMTGVPSPSTDLVAAISDTSVCAGWGGYVVVRRRVVAGEQGAVCQFLGMANVDIVSSDRKELKAITKTLTSCVEPNRLVWINSFDEEQEKGRFASRIVDDQFQVEIRNEEEKHQVLCKTLG